ARRAEHGRCQTILPFVPRPAARAQAALCARSPDRRARRARPSATDSRPRYRKGDGLHRRAHSRGCGAWYQIRRARAQHDSRCRGRISAERGAADRGGLRVTLTLGGARTPPPEPTFVERLDRVPLNSFHWRLLVIAGIGWMFDAMDVLLIGFLLAPITREFALDATRTGLVASAGFVGMFLGAAISGRLADRYGRRGVFSTT